MTVPRPDRAQVERVLAGLSAGEATAEGGGSAARRMTRIVAATPSWTSGDVRAHEALALAIREVLAMYSSWTRPSEVPDAAIAELVAEALADAEPLRSRADAPVLAIGALGEALSVYHASIELGRVDAAREAVRQRVALALGYMVWSVAMS